MKTFVISDTHFSHRNIIEYCSRPFPLVQEMDETMIRNWNNVVSDDDLVYHVGDFGLTRHYSYLINIMRRLNGKIILLRGNHDDKKFLKTAYDIFGPLDKLRIYDKMVCLLPKSENLLLSHYPSDVEFNQYTNSLPMFYPNQKINLVGS